MRRWCLIALFTLAVRAWALEVILEAGGEPIGPYLAPLEPSDPPRIQRKRAPIASPDRTYRLAHLLPIRSPSLTPGLAQARRTSTRLAQPLFLVGADAESLRWIEANRTRLKALHAVGVLVQAETESELKAVIDAAQDLPLIPASGEAFAKVLGLTHYPVLITHEGMAP